MRVAGVDLSTFAVDVVTVPYDGPGEPVWHRFPLTGTDAFDRARSVADSVPGRSSVFWDELVAVGIEHPAGRHGVGPLLRIQGAILAVIPARMLVEPFPPGKWRKAVGLAGNATKDDVAQFSYARLPQFHYSHTPAVIGYGYFASSNETNPHVVVEERLEYGGWPQDAHDAHLIALATRQAITTEQAA